jgi:uncharacterized membrane protein HdeD (DUF308 family)
MSDERAMATSHERWLIFLVEWALASALCDLILVAIIVAGPPGTPAWAIGLLVAINVTLAGVALVVMAPNWRLSTPGRIYRGVEAKLLKHFGP